MFLRTYPAVPLIFFSHLPCCVHIPLLAYHLPCYAWIFFALTCGHRLNGTGGLNGKFFQRGGDKYPRLPCCGLNFFSHLPCRAINFFFLHLRSILPCCALIFFSLILLSLNIFLRTPLLFPYPAF